MRLIAILGPTASGKSALAYELARRGNFEIIGADAFQMYRGMDVLSAAPSALERAKFPHHLVGFLEPSESYSVAQYQVDARKAIEEAFSRGHDVIMVGGTMLYVRAVLFPYSFPDFEPVKPDGNKTTKELYEELLALDPLSAKEIHPHNRVRILRALEMALSGHPKSEVQKVDISKPLYGAEFYAVVPDRDVLYRRIERRIDQMFDGGAIEEVKTIRETYGEDAPALRAIGGKEILAYLDGKYDLRKAKEEMAKATRHYAKRQLTFLRHQFQYKEVKGGEEIPS